MSGINPVSPRAGLLDQVMKGVQVARDIYGIKHEMNVDDAAEAKAANDADEAERVASGKLNKGEQISYAAKGANVSDKPFDGGAEFTDASTGLKGYLGKRTESPLQKMVEIKVKGPDGTPMIKFVDPNSSETYQAYEKPDAKIPKEETKVLGEGQTLFVKDNNGNWVETAAGNAKNKPATDVQLSAAGYAKRAIASDQISNDLIKGGYDPTNFGARIRNNGLPILSSMTESDEDKQFHQSKLDFVSAVLRKESGAAISKDEYSTEDKKYFPQPGDTPAVVAQKAQSRQRAIATLTAQAAGGMGNVADVPVITKNKTKPGEGTATADPGGKSDLNPSGTPDKPDSTILDYARAYDMDYSTAAHVLGQRGYKP